MIENLALYVPVVHPDVKAVFPSARSDGGLLKKATRYQCATPDGTIELSLMPESDLAAHLQGFTGFVQSETSDRGTLSLTGALIGQTRRVIGVILPQAIDEAGETFAALKKLAFAQGGFIFVHESILTREGYVFGPRMQPVPLSVQVNPAEQARQQAAAPAEDRDRRARSYAWLEANGFHAAASLPVITRAGVRPAEEIARRACALVGLNLHVSAPESYAPEKQVRGFMAMTGLETALTADEAKMFALPRKAAFAAHSNSIGWKLESLWPLAWALGFEPKPMPNAPMMEGELIGEMINFVSALNVSDQAFAQITLQRSAEDCFDLEDLFYCAHNASRSAQMGSKTVPDGFHPMRDGGCVHERRHGLTWMVSSGAWDETDLST